MNLLKIITLALMLVISVTGLRAEEVSTVADSMALPVEMDDATLLLNGEW